MGIRIELKNYIEKIIKERAARKWTRRKAMKVPDGLPHIIVLDGCADDKLSEEERRKLDSCPVVMKDENGNVSMFALGSDVIRFRNKGMAKATMDAVMRSFDETE